MEVGFIDENAIEKHFKKIVAQFRDLDVYLCEYCAYQLRRERLPVVFWWCSREVAKDLNLHFSYVVYRVSRISASVSPYGSGLAGSLRFSFCGRRSWPQDEGFLSVSRALIEPGFVRVLERWFGHLFREKDRFLREVRADGEFWRAVGESLSELVAEYVLSKE